MFKRRRSNILDPIRNSLDPSVWDRPEEPQPLLKPVHKRWITSTIYKTLEQYGYEGGERWGKLYLTGSLCTYQYSDQSDCDVSLFVDAQQLPDWSRAEMIGIMTSHLDGTKVPGTSHSIQTYVVSSRFQPTDLYKPGLRAGYDIASDTWVAPPEKSRSHDVASEWPASYSLALEQSDKAALLIRYEPEKAVMFLHQLHHRRHQDMNVRGKGDYTDSNLVWKMLENRGLLSQLADLSGEYIA